MESRSFFSFSFGCRVNQAEKEMLDQKLLMLGWQYNPSSPQVYIINTCAVTAKAEREARQLIYQIHRQLPKTKIIVTGCAATNWLKKKLTVPEIYLLVDNQNKDYLAELIARYFVRQKRQLLQQPPQITTPIIATDKYQSSYRRMIRIQTGCHRFCGYCIVPYLRGLPRSTPISSIIKTINVLPGVKEIILTAINTEAYGYDTGETLIKLLKKILQQTSVPRVSLGSIHPWSLTTEFFQFYKSTLHQGRLVNFFHIPIQSASNKILKLMKRQYTMEEISQIFDQIIMIEPTAFIATDVIVGFLEETLEDFTITYNFLASAPIHRFHVFRFSPRPHTAAFYLQKKLSAPSEQIKRERSQELIALSRKKYQAYIQSLIGKSLPVLILEKTVSNQRLALLNNQTTIYLPKKKANPGQIRMVNIKDCKNIQLFGKIV